MIDRPPKPALPPWPLMLEKLLLVEGDTPLHFCEALLRELGIEKAIAIRSFGGIGDVAAYLKAIAATPGFTHVTSLGIVRDAEANPPADVRLALQAALASAGLSAQQRPQLRTSLFILPDDQNLGMIETLCLDAVRQEPSLAAANTCVEQFFDCLQKGSVTLPDPLKLVKNKAQAYPATRKDSQLFPGTAAYRGHWPWNVGAMDPLKRFLQGL